MIQYQEETRKTATQDGLFTLVTFQHQFVETPPELSARNPSAARKISLETPWFQDTSLFVLLGRGKKKELPSACIPSKMKNRRTLRSGDYIAAPGGRFSLEPLIIIL